MRLVKDDHRGVTESNNNSVSSRHQIELQREWSEYKLIMDLVMRTLLTIELISRDIVWNSYGFLKSYKKR